MEARLTRVAREAGAPAPWVGEVVEQDGRFGFEMERIDGPPLAKHVGSATAAVPELAEAMARAHVAVHRAVGGVGLRAQHDRLAEKIRRAPRLSAGLQRRVLVRLRKLPRGDRLCHGDFHPQNLVVTDEGIRVIDWVDVTAGHPAADVARSELVLRLATITDSAVTGEKQRQIRRFLEAYVDAYCRLAPCPRESITPWLPVVAAARLCEDVPGESAWLLRAVQDAVGTDG